MFSFFISALSVMNHSPKRLLMNRGTKCIMNTAASDDKNKNMCGSVASYSICSEQRPDNKQTALCKKES